MATANQDRNDGEGIKHDWLRYTGIKDVVQMTNDDKH